MEVRARGIEDDAKPTHGSHPMLTEIIKFKRNTVLAIRGLWLHKLRAFLSVLGIIIGIASVIALLAFGKGSMKEALDAIKRFEKNR